MVKKMDVGKKEASTNGVEHPADALNSQLSLDCRMTVAPKLFYDTNICGQAVCCYRDRQTRRLPKNELPDVGRGELQQHLSPLRLICFFLPALKRVGMKRTK